MSNDDGALMHPNGLPFGEAVAHVRRGIKSFAVLTKDYLKNLLATKSPANDHHENVSRRQGNHAGEQRNKLRVFNNPQDADSHVRYQFS